jgi:hypothetical protein
MSTFDGFYFVSKDYPNVDGYKVVKFGDTRSTSSNFSNYRGTAIKMFLHGNNSDSSVGKQLENILKDLVSNELAIQIGSSESYVVTDSTFTTLKKNSSSPDSTKSYTTTEEVDIIKNMKINKLTARIIDDKKLIKKFSTDTSVKF